MTDLLGTNFNAYVEPFNAGESFDIDFDIFNDGSSDAGPFSVDFYLSYDTIIGDSSDYYLGSYSISGLTGNTTSSFTANSLRLPGANNLYWGVDGTYHIGMVIDPNNSVVETDELNNDSTGVDADYDSVDITIPVTLNTSPTDISLSNSSVLENQPVNTIVGTLSAADIDSGDTFTYSLVKGTGDVDNAAFVIDGDILKIAQSFDYENKDSYNIRVRTTDSAGDTYEEALTIGVTNQPGNDIIGTSGSDSLEGTDEEDTISGLKGKDKLFGLDGDDLLYGGKSKDRLDGGAGDDKLDGGKGSDVLIGGTGFDTFILKEKYGVDKIKDFVDGEDKLKLLGGLDFGDIEVTQSGNKTLIRTDDSKLALLTGVQASQITIADFV